MTYYIVIRKADNFRTSGFTIAVATCIPFCACTWVVYSVCIYILVYYACILSVFSTTCLLFLCLVICFICVFYGLSAIYASSALSASTFTMPVPGFSTSSISISLSAMLVLVRVFYGLSAVPVPELSTPSAFSVAYPLRLHLRLLYLC